MSSEQEIYRMSPEAFDALHPFSFVTDQRGIIQHAGASLRKLMCGEELRHHHFDEFFELKQPTLGLVEVRPDLMVLEVVVLTSRLTRALTVRGQVVRLPGRESRYLFSVKPLFFEPEQATAAGLDFSDFEIGEPLFDFFIALRERQTALINLKKINEQLLLSSHMALMLQRITSDAYRIEEPQALYRKAISTTCQELGWDIGHVFFLDENEPKHLTSSSIWYLSDPNRYEPFVRRTAEVLWNQVGEFPAFAANLPRVVWISEYARYGDHTRSRALPQGEHSTAVSVPISIGDRCAAILEFISEKPKVFTEAMYGLFALLGDQLGYALTHHESTRKEREQLAALAYASKMATLGEIAAGVAHEINNPVSTISLIAQILKRSTATGNVSRELIESQIPKIELCVDRVAKIVSELRDFSRESSRDPYRVESVTKIMSDAVDLCHARFLAQHIPLQLATCSETCLIECRASQISQIVLNLLNNAFDAVVGSPECWVRLECIDRGDKIEIAVCDSGPGVSEEIRDRVMKPFFTTKPPGRGTGLGLSISSNIAIDHRGRLELDTAAPHTRFVVTLPKRQTP